MFYLLENLEPSHHFFSFLSLCPLSRPLCSNLSHFSTSLDSLMVFRKVVFMLESSVKCKKPPKLQLGRERTSQREWAALGPSKSQLNSRVAPNEWWKTHLRLLAKAWLSLMILKLKSNAGQNIVFISVIWFKVYYLLVWYLIFFAGLLHIGM